VNVPPFDYGGTELVVELSVSGLQIGGSRVALQFRRHRERILANLLSIEGEPLQVRLELGSMEAEGLASRVCGIAAS